MNGGHCKNVTNDDAETLCDCPHGFGGVYCEKSKKQKTELETD
jgi:hypothetical protein